LVRVRASLTENPRAVADTHCATCADCREYFSTVAQLENNLRGEATRLKAPVPGNLNARIFQAVEQSQPEERPRRRQLSWGLTGLAAAALAAVLVFRVQMREPATLPATTASVEDVLVVANSFPKQWLTTLPPEATKILADNPLQTEIASVGSDAQSALRFLALNFLPSKEELTPPPESKARPLGSS
jgi:hypothetical protein